MTSDAHIHLYDFYRASGTVPEIDPEAIVCASAHEKDEFLWQERFAEANPGSVWLSFGIHPQEPVDDEREFLADLAASHRIAAIGECGIDLFTPDFARRLDEQKSVWAFQLELAIAYNLPLVIHCRKALHLLFADTKRLKRLPAVVFHGWPGSLREAESMLNRGVNGFFCAGKALLRGDRSLRETVAGLPVDRLLTETDAPWMAGRGEPYSVPSDIAAVTVAAASLAGMDAASFAERVSVNFRMAFGACPGRS
jgi:TatD DNase family protein